MSKYDDIQLYPEMNEKIADILSLSRDDEEDIVYLYAAKYIKFLQSTLESETKRADEAEKRAVALERALREHAGQNECVLCANKKYIDDETCQPCCTDEIDNFVFDEARFAKQTGGDSGE